MLRKLYLFVIMHYGQKNGGLHRLVYIIIVIMHCHNITKHTCMYVLVLTLCTLEANILA